MKYPWIDAYLTAKRAVTKDLQKDWNWIRYHIGGKMFAAVLLDDSDRPYYINLKLEPLEGELMRSEYPDIIPGYYSNKLHWNSVRADGDIPDELLRHWLDRSYSLVLRALGKQKQREILGVCCCGAECAGCACFGNKCAGCNEARGKVFHAPEGEACPIYACCSGKRRFVTCAECKQVPCEIWRATRDPSLTDEQFQASVDARIRLLKEIYPF